MADHVGLSIENMNFAFNKKMGHFFKDLSLKFTAKGMHFVKGRNGVGKSTFFRLLQAKTNQDERVSGIIHVGDKSYDLKKLHKDADNIAEIKMVQQKFDQMLADRLSFKQNLRLANLPSYPTLDALPTHQKMPLLVEQFNIDMEKPVYLLSGGQRQILTILMSLQKPTKVLLLDEPTAALDDKNTEMVMKFLNELVQTTDLTILIICHDKEVIEKYARDGYFHIQINDNDGARSIGFTA